MAFNFGTSNSTPTTNFSFGNNLSNTNINTSTNPISSGIGGSVTSLGSNISSSSSPFSSSFVGLGGTFVASNNSSSNRSSELKSVKDQVLLPEIISTIDEYNKYIKSQKFVREEIMRMTGKNMFQVEGEVRQLNSLCQQVSSLLQSNILSAVKLRNDVNQELRNVEVAYRTKDTPQGLQPENVLPTEYFQRKIEEFESEVTQQKQQFSDINQFFCSNNHSFLTSPSELSSILLRLNEGFVAMAARLQTIHAAVKKQKESYIKYKKSIDPNDLFKNQTGKVGILSGSSHPPNTSANMTITTIGPTPFLSNPLFSVTSNSSSLLTASINSPGLGLNFK